MKKVLTIAGSDCSGGAGIQADIKTFCAHGVYAMSVITAVTAQNTRGVFDIQDINCDIVGKQLDAIFTDIDVDAVKIGMISNSENIKKISEKLKEYNAKNIVLDPVMISTSGFLLMNPYSKDTLINELILLSRVVTPNIPEAEEISGVKIKNIDDMKKAAKVIHKIGAKNVLIKGGHLIGDAKDILYDGKKFTVFSNARINTKNTHGTGCTLSSAIAANLAIGMDTISACNSAKKYITGAIEHSINIGNGNGPTNHFYELYEKANINY